MTTLVYTCDSLPLCRLGHGGMTGRLSSCSALAMLYSSSSCRPLVAAAATAWRLTVGPTAGGPVAEPDDIDEALLGCRAAAVCDACGGCRLAPNLEAYSSGGAAGVRRLPAGTKPGGILFCWRCRGRQRGVRVIQRLVVLVVLIVVPPFVLHAIAAHADRLARVEPELAERLDVASLQDRLKVQTPHVRNADGARAPPLGAVREHVTAREARDIHAADRDAVAARGRLGVGCRVRVFARKARDAVAAGGRLGVGCRVRVFARKAMTLVLVPPLRLAEAPVVRDGGRDGADEAPRAERGGAAADEEPRLELHPRRQGRVVRLAFAALGRVGGSAGDTRPKRRRRRVPAGAAERRRRRGVEQLFTLPHADAEEPVPQRVAAHERARRLVDGAHGRELEVQVAREATKNGHPGKDGALHGAEAGADVEGAGEDEAVADGLHVLQRRAADHADHLRDAAPTHHHVAGRVERAEVLRPSVHHLAERDAAPHGRQHFGGLVRALIGGVAAPSRLMGGVETDAVAVGRPEADNDDGHVGELVDDRRVARHAVTKLCRAQLPKRVGGGVADQLALRVDGPRPALHDVVRDHAAQQRPEHVRVAVRRVARDVGEVRDVEKVARVRGLRRGEEAVDEQVVQRREDRAGAHAHVVQLDGGVRGADDEHAEEHRLPAVQRRQNDLEDRRRDREAEVQRDVRDDTSTQQNEHGEAGEEQQHAEGRNLAVRQPRLRVRRRRRRIFAEDELVEVVSFLLQRVD
eukprot:CAMPEP_0174880990 /NCGR_PEP_ID=MMETSP1114-20130205/84037_1 /TAXON_ID=312471 /ORGANISM="Neobodo designis, Strain CCAP 1951/1" /LENGTH=747 /DNA_ID=CAMNT_0016116383 /DNA_START=309 /DNA_END=2549 /DNA_ORIENTATION=+